MYVLAACSHAVFCGYVARLSLWLSSLSLTLFLLFLSRMPLAPSSAGVPDGQPPLGESRQHGRQVSPQNTSICAATAAGEHCTPPPSRQRSLRSSLCAGPVAGGCRAAKYPLVRRHWLTVLYSRAATGGDCHRNSSSEQQQQATLRFCARIPSCPNRLPPRSVLSPARNPYGSCSLPWQSWPLPHRSSLATSASAQPRRSRPRPRTHFSRFLATCDALKRPHGQFARRCE
jgi:hypothetical protein